MNAIELIAGLSGSATLTIPPEAAIRLPGSGAARVIVYIAGTPGAGAEWRAASYQQFLADDAPEDAIYDSVR